MKYVFIDTNIWLSLYSFTDDDLNQFAKLRDYIDKDIHLILSSQLYSEILRNRENKIKESWSKFTCQQPQYPAFVKGYDEYQEVKEALDQSIKKFGLMKDKINNDIQNRCLPADETIKQFFDNRELISCDDVIDTAYKRFIIGNPPGKNNKYGDAINWECLLKNVPDESDIYIVSSDKDYQSILNKDAFNPFLQAEWETKKCGSVKYYSRLTHFLEEHIAGIKLKTEEEKEELILSLRNSNSFYSTHGIISNMNAYPDWTRTQIEELCSIAIQNDQVGWILEDNDVLSFYKKLIMPLDLSKIVDSSIHVVAHKIRIKADE